jgi:hypothetical protein
VEEQQNTSEKKKEGGGQKRGGCELWFQGHGPMVMRMKVVAVLLLEGGVVVGTAWVGGRDRRWYVWWGLLV